MSENNNTEKRECKLAGKCGACQTLNMTYERELSMKMANEIKLLGKFGHVEEIIPMEDPTHYRSKVQYVFHWNGGRINYGLYRSTSKDIVHSNSCLMEDREASAVCHAVRRMIDKYKLTVYDGRRGLIRHVFARKAGGTGEIICAIVTSGERFDCAVEFAAELAKRCPAVKSVSRIINTTDIAIWMDGKEEVLFGDGYIEDILCGCRFKISAKSFYQINHAGAEVLYNTAVEYASPNKEDMILDAYCGTGTIGIAAAKKSGSALVGFDVNENAISDAKTNAKINGLTDAKFICGDDGSVKLREISPSIIIADPPRAGCDRKFIDFVIRTFPERFVYVSCNPETLERDLEYLRKKSKYKIRKIQPVDMFPGTLHVETVVLMSKKT